MKRLVLGTLAVVALLALLPAVSLGNYWINYSGLENPIYGQYVVGTLQSGSFYAGPWSAYTQGVNGGTPNPAYYYGSLYCIEANVPEPNGGVFHEHVTTEVAPTGTWTPPGLATNFGLQWATSILRGVTPIIAGNTPEEAQKNRAALQIAIWEALYDGAVGYAHDLHSGVFSVYGGVLHRASNYYGYSYDPSAVLTAADTFLNNADYKHPDAYGRVLHDGQDLLELGQVPEPGSVLLVGLGFLAASGLGLRRRRPR